MRGCNPAKEKILPKMLGKKGKGAKAKMETKKQGLRVEKLAQKTGLYDSENEGFYPLFGRVGINVPIFQFWGFIFLLLRRWKENQ